MGAAESTAAREDTAPAPPVLPSLSPAPRRARLSVRLRALQGWRGRKRTKKRGPRQRDDGLLVTFYTLRMGVYSTVGIQILPGSPGLCPSPGRQPRRSLLPPPRGETPLRHAAAAPPPPAMGLSLPSNPTAPGASAEGGAPAPVQLLSVLLRETTATVLRIRESLDPAIAYDVVFYCMNNTYG